jgi:hypothetical protein
MSIRLTNCSVPNRGIFGFQRARYICTLQMINIAPHTITSMCTWKHVNAFNCYVYFPSCSCMSDSATLPDHFQVQFAEQNCQYADMLRRMANSVLVLLANGMFILYSFTVFCLTTGPKPPPKRFLQQSASQSLLFK